MHVHSNKIRRKDLNTTMGSQRTRAGQGGAGLTMNVMVTESAALMDFAKVLLDQSLLHSFRRARVLKLIT
jgi:hypothetical protein